MYKPARLSSHQQFTKRAVWRTSVSAQGLSSNGMLPVSPVTPVQAAEAKTQCAAAEAATAAAQQRAEEARAAAEVLRTELQERADQVCLCITAHFAQCCLRTNQCCS